MSLIQGYLLQKVQGNNMLFDKMVMMYALKKEAKDTSNPPLYRWGCWYKANKLSKELMKKGII